MCLARLFLHAACAVAVGVVNWSPAKQVVQARSDQRLLPWIYHLRYAPSQLGDCTHTAWYGGAPFRRQLTPLVITSYAS